MKDFLPNFASGVFLLWAGWISVEVVRMGKMLAVIKAKMFKRDIL
jgi:hypothetical protein